MVYNYCPEARAAKPQPQSIYSTWTIVLVTVNQNTCEDAGTKVAVLSTLY